MPDYQVGDWVLFYRPDLKRFKTVDAEDLHLGPIVQKDWGPTLGGRKEWVYQIDTGLEIEELDWRGRPQSRPFKLGVLVEHILLSFSWSPHERSSLPQRTMGPL